MYYVQKSLAHSTYLGGFCNVFLVITFKICIWGRLGKERERAWQRSCSPRSSFTFFFAGSSSLSQPQNVGTPRAWSSDFFTDALGDVIYLLGFKFSSPDWISSSNNTHTSILLLNSFSWRSHRHPHFTCPKYNSLLVPKKCSPPAVVPISENATSSVQDHWQKTWTCHSLSSFHSPYPTISISPWLYHKNISRIWTLLSISTTTLYQSGSQRKHSIFQKW